jgi:alpha-L-fucosidase
MKKKIAVLFITLIFLGSAATSQTKKIDPPKPVLPLPSTAQLQWHEMEMNAFVHFTTNTFTGLEWGNGNESESVFNPTQLDAGQWARTLKETGFKTLILTVSIT